MKYIYTSPEAKALYGEKGLHYATKGSAGFDLKACGFTPQDELTGHLGGVEGVTSDLYGIPDESGVYAKEVFYQIFTAGKAILRPKARLLIQTGIKLAIPQGFCLQIVPRSGLALKHGITITNSPGIIDSDYRGEIGVILHNLGHEPFEIKRGDRIGQAVLAPVVQAKFNEITEEEFNTDQTNRGVGGFGSTGK